MYDRAERPGRGERSAPAGGAEGVTPERARTTEVGSRRWVHGLLLIATLATATWAGAQHQGIDLLARPADGTRGLPYALSLLAILGVHEMGHYVVARRRGVRVSLPYFIPAPIWLGTFGAFIKMGGPIRNRASYFDVGIAGPLAGLVVALAALYFGFVFEGPEAAMDHGFSPASSFLVAAVYRLAGGAELTATVQMGPVAFAGWLGLIVTALNLAPVGQLDGGHIAYATLGARTARKVSRLVIVLLVGGGLLVGSHLAMWGILIWLVAGTTHPSAEDDTMPIGTGRTALAGLSLLLLLAILLPAPFSA